MIHDLKLVAIHLFINDLQPLPDGYALNPHQGVDLKR